MGKASYRWERRARRFSSHQSYRLRNDLLGLQIVLLILIGAFWLIGARLLPIYAVVPLPCAEMVADFGAGQYGVPVFELLLGATILLAVFWGVIGIAYRAVIFPRRQVWFHLVLLFMIILLGLSFKSMTLKYNNPPDGTINIVPRGNMDIQKGRWVMGQSDMALEQRCVWLDRSTVSANPTEPSDMLPKSFGLKWLSLQNVKDLQVYRPLTPTERERFLRKQTCLASSPSHVRDCDFGWVFNNAYIYGEDVGAFYPSPRQGPRLP